MSRRLPADMRTPDLFSGKTKLEELEDMAREEAEAAATVREGDPTKIAEAAHTNAIRWLGLDAFHEGDDLALALHPEGHGVLVFVQKAKDGTERSSAQFKLSRAQVQKLKTLGKEIP